MQKQINNLLEKNDKLYARIKALEVQFNYKDIVIEEGNHEKDRLSNKLKSRDGILFKLINLEMKSKLNAANSKAREQENVSIVFHFF